jgi:hypothetical protein
MARQPFIARGFRARSSRMPEAPRRPPGQYEANDFPVRSAGPTPPRSLSHLYFWKSAKWVRGLRFLLTDSPLLGAARIPRSRRPVA